MKIHSFLVLNLLCTFYLTAQPSKQLVEVIVTPDLDPDSTCQDGNPGRICN